MDWIEVTARSVDDAKELALDRLGVVEDELEFEVLDEARGGLFRRSEARIRARVKPLSREKPVDRRRRRRGGERTGRSSSGRPRTTTAVAEAPEADPNENGSSGTADAPGEASGSSRSRSRRRRGGRGRGGGTNGGDRAGGARAPRMETNDDVDQEKAEAEVDVETVPVEEQAAHAAEFAGELVRTMGFTATVTTDVEDDNVTVRIDGENLGVLVGPRAVTLQALEEVVRAAVQRFAGGHGARIHVDVAGYRERRRQALAEFARKIAEQTKESGSARSLEPMNASDRKVVHDTVAE